MAPVYLRHGGVWLKIKEVYNVYTSPKRRRKSRTTSSQQSLVAEMVAKPEINGLRYVESMIVSSSKVSRFIARLHLAAPQIVAVVEPYGDDYIVKFYGKTKQDALEAKRLGERIARELQVRGSVAEEEEIEAGDVEEE
ncbi:MAG TPA: hypothetical protein EYH26_04140 [Pyrodictium sp.]|nr:hypothetical protein [Pyrodictium sp.]HIQ11147.1 hypothetical protein [Pyrodictium sp.]HIQ56140.1 hypothetical protein [Pyrodictium sp.]